jgi:hypothetical protein
MASGSALWGVSAPARPEASKLTISISGVERLEVKVIVAGHGIDDVTNA